MTEITQKVPTPQWGPVSVDLVSCDYCGTVAQRDLAVGWAKLSNYGIQVNTMQDTFSDEAHFCSFRCLGEYVNAVTGANGQG